MTVCWHYIGAISPDWAANWNAAQGSPFDVVVDPKIKISPPSGNYPFFDLEKHLADKRDIDWGSGAWRGKKEDFERLLTDWRMDLGQIGFMNDEGLYAFVFIEMW